MRTIVMWSLVLCALACGPEGGVNGTGGGSGSTGGGAGSTGGGGGTVTCTPMVSLQVGLAGGRTLLTGTGRASCTGPTGVEVETCLEMNSGGSWGDVLCATESQSSVDMLAATVTSSCLGVKTFRARVTVTAGGASQALHAGEQTVTCQ